MSKRAAVPKKWQPATRPRTTTKFWDSTRRDLKQISFMTGETMTAIMDRLAKRELRALQAKENKTK